MPPVRAATTRAGLCAVLAAALAYATTAVAAPHASRDLILPAHARTPGVTNPAVTKATIGTTICVKNWTKTIRPPTSYTNALKAKQMLQYNESGPRPTTKKTTSFRSSWAARPKTRATSGPNRTPNQRSQTRSRRSSTA